MLTVCIVVWLGNANAQERRRLKKESDGHCLIDHEYTAIKGIYCLKTATNIIGDPHHMGHALCSLLPLGK